MKPWKEVIDEEVFEVLAAIIALFEDVKRRHPETEGENFNCPYFTRLAKAKNNCLDIIKKNNQEIRNAKEKE